MKITFYKYHGTGNDFIMIDNRNQTFPKNNTKLIQQLCQRRFGVGADGLILLENHDRYDFKMVYYNSDGSTSTMCGNGGRCIVAFSKFLGICSDDAHFEASDGYHYATLEDDYVALQMKDVDDVMIESSYWFVDTGSPHHIIMTDNLSDVNVKKDGAKIRYSDLYGEPGSNVNFVHQEDENTFSIRTYERGVEDETLSCGTGATAVALAMRMAKKTEANKVNINVLGGELEISFHEEDGEFTYVFLKGKALKVFKGEIEI